MLEQSMVNPLSTYNFTIEEIGQGKCDIHFYENIEESVDENGDIIYSYEFYTVKNVTYHSNLEKNIINNKAKWLEMAKEMENAEPGYSDIQIMQQSITDLELENIEQGQIITDLELTILEG